MAGGGFLSSMFTTMVAKMHSLASPSTTSSSSSSSPRRNIEQEMRKLTTTMRRIQAKLADSEEENHVKNSHSEKLWLSELKDVAYDAEDVVEEYEYEVLRSKQLHSGTHDQDELANKAAEIKKRFDEITKEWKLLTLPKNVGKRKRSPSPPLVGNRETSSLVVESDVLGREEEKDMLVEWLLSEDDTTENGVSVIAVIGMGGLGKTTLARLVYNDPRVESYFDLRGWVCVSENFHVASLTEKILQSFTIVKVLEELDGLQHAIQENLQGKKFLLILDDVWNEKFTLWDELRKPLVSAQVGKVIVTTRNQSVARIMHARSPLNLNCLPFDVCWSLFKRVALGGADKCLQPHLEDVGRKIVDKCKGLPLAVKVLGGALRDKEDVDPWVNILESEMWESEERDNEVLLALRISYDCMPIQLKRCFQYLALFPKGMSLDSGEIVRLWMSQGLLPLNKDKTAEGIGRNYIIRLVERSIIHEWGVDLHEPFYFIDDRDQSYLMHDLVHDLAQHMAQDECLCVIDGKFDAEKLQKIRHLSVSIEDPHLQKDLETITDRRQLKLMRTLFFKVQDKSRGQPFITREDKNFGVDLFQNLEKIRALHLSLIGITELPYSLGNLKLLSYLSIKDTNVESIPESICNLYNLQTLDLTHTNIREFPRQIGNLINLRHLLPPYKHVFLPSRIGNLTNLQTLTHFNISCEKEYGDTRELNSSMTSNSQTLSNFNVSCEKEQTLTHFNVNCEKEHCDIGELNSLMSNSCEKESCDIGELNSLMKLEELVISNVTSLNRFSNSTPPLKTKKYLRILRLDWVKRVGETKLDKKKAEPQLAYLQPHVNLKYLYIYSYPGVRFVEWVGDSSFTKLTRLQLKDCDNCTKLPPLGQLPSLEYLLIHRLDGIQHVGREFCSMQMASPSSSQNKIAFPSLKHLEFHDMLFWEVWDGVEIGDFPNLHFLNISTCYPLIGFPQLPFMSSVKEMILDCGAVPDVSICRSLTNLNIDLAGQKQYKWMSKCCFPTLQELTLANIRVKFVHLSQEQLPSLKTLEIYYSEKLRIVTGLKDFTSLNFVKIESCPNLKFKKLPVTLKQVKLNECPLFERGFIEQQHMRNVLGEEMETEELMELQDSTDEEDDNSSDDDSIDEEDDNSDDDSMDEGSQG